MANVTLTKDHWIYSTAVVWLMYIISVQPKYRVVNGTRGLNFVPPGNAAVSSPNPYCEESLS